MAAAAETAGAKAAAATEEAKAAGGKAVVEAMVVREATADSAEAMAVAAELEALEGVGVGWENEWDAHEAPLLKRMPDWREVGALAFGDVLTARLEAQSRLRAST